MCFNSNVHSSRVTMDGPAAAWRPESPILVQVWSYKQYLPSWKIVFCDYAAQKELPRCYEVKVSVKELLRMLHNGKEMDFCHLVPLLLPAINSIFPVSLCQIKMLFSIHSVNKCKVSISTTGCQVFPVMLNTQSGQIPFAEKSFRLFAQYSVQK